MSAHTTHSFIDMPSVSASNRLERSARSLTWPPTTVRLRADEMPHIMATAPAPPPATSAAPHKKPIHDPFEDEINANPAAHFLSPVQMYEYEDWAEDSDDGEEVEWDAGITDFALFEDDRRRAQERHEDVPGRWETLLSSQASALQRAVLRNRADSDPSRNSTNPSHTKGWTPLLEDLPQLTPDNSPKLRDDFDIESYCGQNAPRPSIPSYLNECMPSDEETDSDGSDLDDDELPVAYLVERARERRRHDRKLERPGMRSNRTLSGRTHVWRRPSYHIYDVGEDPEAERKAEQLASTTTVPAFKSEEQRGRRR